MTHDESWFDPTMECGDGMIDLCHLEYDDYERDIVFNLTEPCSSDFSFKDQDRYNYLKNRNAVSSDNDKIFATAVKSEWIALYYASDRIKGNFDIVAAAISFCGAALRWASDELRSDKRIVLIAVANFGTSLSYASSELQDDEEVVMCAVQVSAAALVSASPRLRNHEGIVMAAIKSGMRVLRFLSINGEVRNNRSIVMKAVGANANSLQFAPKKFQNDFEIVMKAVSVDGGALEFASKTLQDNDKVVAMAVSTSPDGFRYASKRLRDNFNIVAAAVEIYGLQIIWYASTRFKCNKHLLLTSLRQFNFDEANNAIFCVPPLAALAALDDLSDKAFILEMLQHNGLLLRQYKQFSDDIEMVTAAVNSVGMSIQYASRRLQANKLIALAAVSNDGSSVEYLADELLDDMDIIRATTLSSKTILDDVFEGCENYHMLACELISNWVTKSPMWRQFNRGKSVLWLYDQYQIIAPACLERWLSDMLCICRTHAAFLVAIRSVHRTVIVDNLVGEMLGMPTGNDLKIIKTAWIVIQHFYSNGRTKFPSAS